MHVQFSFAYCDVVKKWLNNFLFIIIKNAWLSSQVVAFTLIPNYIVKYEQTKQKEYT